MTETLAMAKTRVMAMVRLFEEGHIYLKVSPIT
jgi:hypothetical protein